MSGGQDATGRYSVYLPNNCQAVRSDECPHIDKDDCQLRGNLLKLLILRQSNNPVTLGFVFRRPITYLKSYYKIQGRDDHIPFLRLRWMLTITDESQK